MPDRAVHWLLVFSALAAVSFFCVGLTSYFERRPDRPLWVRGIHDAGMLLSLVHLVAVVVLDPRSDGFAVAGIIMYTTSVALFLSAIEAASRTRLQRAFIDLPLPDRLITDGPYRWVRHPFYDCMALFVISIALMMANWFVIVAGGVMFTLLAIRSRTEERKLLERFGEPYRAYRARTGGFLPKMLI
jgi:protein-S-isoprenylcysteine O-methyltransferase Ste14